MRIILLIILFLPLLSFGQSTNLANNKIIVSSTQVSLPGMAPAAKSLVTIDATTGLLDVIAIVGNYGADAGVSDAYAITIPGATWVIGNTYNIYCNTANTGACTVELNGGAPIPIKVFHDQDPPDNYIEAESIISGIFDGTNLQVISPDANP